MITAQPVSTCFHQSFPVGERVLSVAVCALFSFVHVEVESVNITEFI